MEVFKPMDTYTGPKLAEFKTLSENEVKLVIMSMATKNCELDAIPMALLQKTLPNTIRVITCIVNISLSQGVFARDWKMALVKPLLKKQGLELVLSNYQPVSN